MRSSLILIIGLLSQWSPDKVEAGFVSYDHQVVSAYTRAVYVRPNLPNLVVGPYQRRFYPNLEFRMLKPGTTNSSLYKVLMNLSYPEEVDRNTNAPGPHDNLITVGSEVDSNKVYKVDDGCYKYSWWNGVHKTTDSCHGSRGAWERKYYLMPNYLWERYKEVFPKLKRGSFGGLVAGIPYTFRSSFVYAVWMKHPERCSSECHLHETKAY